MPHSFILLWVQLVLLKTSKECNPFFVSFGILLLSACLFHILWELFVLRTNNNNNKKQLILFEVIFSWLFTQRSWSLPLHKLFTFTQFWLAQEGFIFSILQVFIQYCSNVWFVSHFSLSGYRHFFLFHLSTKLKLQFQSAWDLFVAHRFYKSTQFLAVLQKRK